MSAADQTSVEVEVEVDEQTQALRQLLRRRYTYLDRKWDIVFWVTAAFVVGAAAELTTMLLVGDWDFYTDWKDRQWWPMVTPFAIIIVPSALQYLHWHVWRMPTGAVYTALCAGIASWVGRIVQWDWFGGFPLNYVWPLTMIVAAIWLDWVLLKTKSFLLTSLIGSVGFTLIWWASNHVLMAPFRQTADWNGMTMTVADVQGVEYVKSQSPEYLRLVEAGSLSAFDGQTLPVALALGATLAVGGYGVGQLIGRFLLTWPVGRFIKGR
jgi:methane/ammonia monooxygenase subunit A